MLFYIKIHGLDLLTMQASSLEYPCHDLLEALNCCKVAVYNGFMAELLIEEGN